MLSLVSSEIICCRTKLRCCCVQKFCFTAVHQSLLPSVTKSSDDPALKRANLISDRISWFVYSWWFLLDLNQAVSWKLKSNRQFYGWISTVPCLLFSGPSTVTKFHREPIARIKQKPKLLIFLNLSVIFTKKFSKQRVFLRTSYPFLSFFRGLHAVTQLSFPYSSAADPLPLFDSKGLSFVLWITILLPAWSR